MPLFPSQSASVSTSVPVPADRTLQAWTYDPMLAQSTLILTSGQIQYTRIRIPYPITITKIWFNATVVGSGFVAAQNFMALYSGDGSTLLASADASTAWASLNFQSVTVTAVTLPVGYCYVAFLGNATTNVTLARIIGSGASNNGNMGATTTPGVGYVAGHSSTGGLTALPSTMTSLVVGGGEGFWAGLS